MSIRVLVTITAVQGKGAELAAIYTERCAASMKEPGCEQFEIFRSAIDPDRLILCEQWKDEAALAAHSKVNENRAALPKGLRLEAQHEHYEYHRVR